MSIDRAVFLFSSKFKGSVKSWEWICDCSNGRYRSPDFELTEEQRQYARQAGYLPTIETININKK